MAQRDERADVALGFRQFTAGQVDAATAITAVSGGVPAGSNRVLIHCTAQAIRYTDDGTAPTTAVGIPLAVGTTLDYKSAGISRLQFIATTAGAIVNLNFYG